MATTLTGENAFALQAALIEQTHRFTDEYGDMALERLDGEEASFERLQEALTSLPFLAPKKLVVLRTPGANKQFAERAEQLLGDMPETTQAIIIEPKLDKRSSYYKFLQKHTDFHDFKQLDVSGLARWLVERAAAQKGSLSAADARYLVERVGVNQQLLGGELDKLLLYDKKITRATIDLLTDQTPQGKIFDLLDAAFAGDTRRMLALYDEQRALKVEPQQIIAMLTWQLHVLAVIKAAGNRGPQAIAAEAKLNPFVVQKSQAIARKLSIDDVKKLVRDLLTIDTRLKRESLDADDVLKHYLLRLTSL
ncbi:MAG TPA: DNA polymerase III subunit delta [Candidatus Saccharimonadales bacterium]|nr:DNA polymerase III subunit delta [Candidatus Saccharimonadales bacterium]